MKELRESLKVGKERGVKNCFASVVDKRLKIKNLGEDMQLATPTKDGKDRFVAYF